MMRAAAYGSVSYRLTYKYIVLSLCSSGDVELTDQLICSMVASSAAGTVTDIDQNTIPCETLFSTGLTHCRN
jgi:hypothetical protein